MGDIFKGSTKQVGQVDSLTPEQRELYNQQLQQLGPQYISTLQSLLEGMDPETMQEVFNQTVLQPSMQTFEQDVLPAVQQRYIGAGAGSSSALNQALAKSAENLTTSLGSQYGQFAQNQQQLGLSGLQLANPYQPNISPLLQQQQGILGPLIGSAGSIGAGYFMSSEKVKQNINDFDHGLDWLRKMNVKKYDYIDEVGGEKGQIGMIAEELPEQLTKMHNDILHVNIYALLSVVVNAVKELDERLANLENKNG